MIITGGRLPPTVTAFTFFYSFLITKYTKITKREKHPPQRRVFFSWFHTNFLCVLGSPFGRAVGGNAD